MKFATAVYGEAMIQSAEMDVLGILDHRSLYWFTSQTQLRTSQHCSIPYADIIRMDIDYEGDVRRWGVW
jgi:hypothetical protein